MKRSINWIWAIFFLVASCGPALSGDVSEPKGESTIATGAETSTYDAPPQKFNSRPHKPHQRSWKSNTKNYADMPVLKMRLNQCYGIKNKKGKSAQIATSPASGSRSGSASHTPKKRRKSKNQKNTSLQLPSAPSATPMESMAEESLAQDSFTSRKDDSSAESAEIAVSDDRELSEYEDWGAEIYLSNDDTMSLSSAQRIIYAIDNFLPLPSEHIRPHELLNYFSFETQRVGKNNDFSVLSDITKDPRENGVFSLALAVKGRPVDLRSRRNVALTWVIDRSGSMSDNGRMEYLKRGLHRSLKELKKGDMIHMVLFDHSVCAPVENFVVGRDDMESLERAIDALRPQGSTDIHLGLSKGYDIADRSYQPDHSNRLVLITDAITNTGVTNEQTISMISKYYDSRRIRLSGVGVGRNFNDSLLDKLTERGKGAYVFLGSEAEVDAVFGPKFISMIETTALDVHFLLHLPKSLRMNVFYGEESSTVKEDVQAIHYFANTSQLFLSDLMARGGALRLEDDVMLSIEYQDPETGDELFEEYAFNLGDIYADSYNVKKGHLIMAWVDMLAQMAARPEPSVYKYSAGAWNDAGGWQICDDGKHELKRLSQGLENDNETRRVLDLWEKFCARYERPRNPVKREVVRPENSWPGAQANDPR